jgi:hypothetical protein
MTKPELKQKLEELERRVKWLEEHSYLYYLIPCYTPQPAYPSTPYVNTDNTSAGFPQ